MTTSKLSEEASFADVSALIEGEKAAALASFRPQAFRRAVLHRLEERRRPGWAGSPRLAAASAFALLLVTWTVLVPEPRAMRRPVDLRLVERALLHGTGVRAAGRVATPTEPALSDDVWTIERALLTWRRQQAGRVDVERALCLAIPSGASRSCPSHEARDAAAPGARRRLERALTELDRDGTIQRALLGRRT